ncbi:MAG TPA: phosphoglycerate dehydrogenase [Smithellaceae bacterium]|jgi:D-3-phosphoglycerate dehydrogenase|nr:phosphoglycerate dehydrogenase [Syntrophaceae bacterium]NMC90781.1 phosphoglycerate dehydrogenase [Smithella sp.]HNV56473.1 phosphoglycerate dehydrogenase [Smithellaceae bacterium]MBP8665722.1 phosphoglycerate dehydrogenase [Syntrophaceae bacterium]HNY96113.1 phosphoglycerate dehydrogenase [Smithellaceae bacterium]
MKRVLVSDSMAPEVAAILGNTPGIKVDVKTGMKPDELKAVIKDYDALIVRSSTKVTAEIIEAAAKLSAIGRAGAGVDNIDIPAASKRGIVVMNTPGGNTVTTAEHAIAMMLALARRIPQATASMKAGRWEKSRFMGNEYCNKTLGVIGLGRVGAVVADRAIGLKMNVIAHDPFISPEVAQQMGVNMVNLDELFTNSDFISVHCPLSKETRNLINESALAKMKKGVFLIHCARGGIVNEKALCRALKAGQVAGAAIDVFEEEPTKNMELVGLDNVICTPHLGASTDEAQTNVAIAIAHQIAAYFTTGEIKGAVNFPSVSADVMAGIRPYLDLAEKLGAFQAQLLTGAIQEVSLEYSGEILNHNVAPITVSLIKGLLDQILTETVNYINAPVLAKERGIRIIEVKSSETKDYTNLIALTVRTSKETSRTSGAVFGQNDPRIVRINEFSVEIAPEGYLLAVSNKDVPGVIGNLGTTLGSHNVNIARLHLSRDAQSKKALVVLNTDSPVGPDILDKLRKLPHVVSITPIKM